MLAGVAVKDRKEVRKEMRGGKVEVFLYTRDERTRVNKVDNEGDKVKLKLE